MGLFDKKYCDICGNKIKLLGNKKLEDANMCKECASKLSPWFSERRHSSLEEIKAQLAYREENRQAVRDFHTTRSLGRGSSKLLIDEDARKFTVTSARDLESANPDILDYAQVTGCDLDIDESRRELKKTDKDGKSVSYNPPRYEYSYSFYATIRVNHPYFDEMRFSFSNGYVHTGEMQMGAAVPAGPGWKHNRVNAGTGAREYEECVSLGNEVRELVLGMREDTRAEIDAQNAPKAAVTCPWCGATTFPDKNGCCEYCGGSLND